MKASDADVRGRLQVAGHILADMFPGRAFCLFVFPSVDAEKQHYIANAPRSEVIAAMREMIAKGEPSQLPEAPERN